ncbi:M-phase inducer phosphatase [Xylariaceae sp. FL0255]|nr:M-phase inducer phosphatase [Xylariaceae sp. FL0255]
MDSSSPLAAMHPTAAPAWSQQTHGPFVSGNPFATKPNFRNQLHRTQYDYFNMKTVRGSSPSASLAADLSQNFSIDSENSPRIPTPRRALFTNMMAPTMVSQEYITTPPLPASSSPVPMRDEMDISPLPQKTVLCASIEITSPTPIQSPEDDDIDMIMESPIAMMRPPIAMLDIPRSINDGRKRLGLRRPSLTRSKGYTTSNLLSRLHPESQVSSFKFGGETRFSGASSGMSPGECFQDSPPQERRPQTANSPQASSAGSFRPKPQFASLTGTRDIRSNVSPIGGHSRRQSNPFNRPRRPYRRSLSMFENPCDVVKANVDDEPMPQNTLQSVMDVEETQEPILPHFFPDDEGDRIPRISRSTFLDLQDGKFNECFTQKVIIDCRFEYEYEGGHINGAINYNDKELLARHLFETPMEGKTILIFHCEYSVHRAPRMARHVRAEDRSANAESYPHLTYPEVYILEGGYSEFFKLHRERCYPQAYVEMDAAEHANTCEREMGKLQQKRKCLGRSKTFAFGQREPMVNESPTAPTRQTEFPSPDMMIGNSPILGNYRSPARRMVSY